MRPTSIIALEASPLTLRLHEPFAIAGGAPAAAENVLVRVRLASGAEGLGEAAPLTAVSGETQSSSLAAVLSVRERVVGRDVLGWRAIAGDLAAALPAEPAARCAVEQAALDALGRHHGLPLYALFGGQGAPLETDITVTAGGVEHAVRAARAAEARGIYTLKVKVGALSPAEDAARLSAIHAAVPGARLVIDANGGYDAAGALDLIARIEAERLPVELFEQPVAREAHADLVRIARQSSVLVCADESARSAEDVLRLAPLGARCAVNIKLMKCGVAEALAMWSVARAAGMPLMIGGMVESVLSMSFSAHLASGLGGFSFIDLDTPMFIADSPFVGGFEQEGAALRIGHVTAGHGVSMGRVSL